MWRSSAAVLAVMMSLIACGDDGDTATDAESSGSASAEGSDTGGEESGGTGGGSELCQAPGGTVPVCDRRANESICVEFWGSWPTIDGHAQVCEDEGGTFSAASNCPTDGNLDGWCVVQFGNDRTANFSYDMTIDPFTCTEPFGYSGSWCPG